MYVFMLIFNPNLFIFRNRAVALFNTNVSDRGHDPINVANVHSFLFAVYQARGMHATVHGDEVEAALSKEQTVETSSENKSGAPIM